MGKSDRMLEDFEKENLKLSEEEVYLNQYFEERSTGNILEKQDLEDLILKLEEKIGQTRNNNGDLQREIENLNLEVRRVKQRHELTEKVTMRDSTLEKTMRGEESFDANFEAVNGGNYGGLPMSAQRDGSYGASGGECNEFPDRSPIFNYLNECRAKETSLPSKLKSKFERNRKPGLGLGDESNTRDAANNGSQVRDRSRDKSMVTESHVMRQSPGRSSSPPRDLVENLAYDDVRMSETEINQVRVHCEERMNQVRAEEQDRLDKAQAEAAIYNYKTYGGPTIVDPMMDPLDYQITEELGAETGTDSDRKYLPGFKYNDSTDSRDMPVPGPNNMTPELISGPLANSNYRNSQDDWPKPALVNSYTVSQANHLRTYNTSSSEFGKTGLPESYVSRLPQYQSHSEGKLLECQVDMSKGEDPKPKLIESLVAEGLQDSPGVSRGQGRGVAENTDSNISPVRYSHENADHVPELGDHSLLTSK